MLDAVGDELGDEQANVEGEALVDVVLEVGQSEPCRRDGVRAARELEAHLRVLSARLLVRAVHCSSRRRLGETRAARRHATGGGCEASVNSRNSPVTTNAVCSPMSTALSPIRSSARATSIITIAHSRISASSPISIASLKTSRFSLLRQAS